jgi:hypothetical protein
MAWYLRKLLIRLEAGDFLIGWICLVNKLEMMWLVFPENFAENPVQRREVSEKTKPRSCCPLSTRTTLLTRVTGSRRTNKKHHAPKLPSRRFAARSFLYSHAISAQETGCVLPRFVPPSLASPLFFLATPFMFLAVLSPPSVCLASPSSLPPKRC